MRAVAVVCLLVALGSAWAWQMPQQQSGFYGQPQQQFAAVPGQPGQAAPYYGNMQQVVPVAPVAYQPQAQQYAMPGSYAQAAQPMPQQFIGQDARFMQQRVQDIDDL